MTRVASEPDILALSLVEPPIISHFDRLLRGGFDLDESKVMNISALKPGPSRSLTPDDLLLEDFGSYNSCASQASDREAVLRFFRALPRYD